MSPRRSLWHSLAVLIMLTSALTGRAATVRAGRQGRYLDVEVTGVSLPREELARAFRSGLTTTLRVDLVLEHAETHVLLKRTRIDVVYDLWDEIYRVKFMTTSESWERTARTQDAVFTLLSNLHFSRVVPWEAVHRLVPFQVECTVQVSPVEAAKVKEIKKLIGQSNAEITPAGGSYVPVIAPGMRFNPLFKAILRQYLSDDKVKAKWSESSKSAPVTGGKEINDPKR